MLYGLVVSVPIGAPLAKNATAVTDPSASLAVADTVMAVPAATDVPPAGVVRLTEGGLFGGGVTVIAIAAEVVVAPWLSVAVAVSE